MTKIKNFKSRTRCIYHCFVLCLYSLKDSASVQWGVWCGAAEVLNGPKAFFARMEDFCFVLSMMCRLDAEHTENMPYVGHLLYSDYSEKIRYHISANGDVLKTFR